MTKPMQTLALVLTIALAAPLAAAAQENEKPAPKASNAASSVMPLKLQITISRYQGEKKISSMPYSLSMNAGAQPPNNFANLRMGTKIPVMMVSAVDAKLPDGKPIPPDSVSGRRHEYRLPRDGARRRTVSALDYRRRFLGVPRRAAPRRLERQSRVSIVPREQLDGGAQRRDRPVHDRHR